jgi:kynurenine formamidase
MEYEFDGRRARYTHEMPVDAYTGQAIVLKIDIEPWGLITDKHLDAACEKYGIDQAGLEGKIICLNTACTVSLTIQGILSLRGRHRN